MYTKTLSRQGSRRLRHALQPHAMQSRLTEHSHPPVRLAQTVTAPSSRCPLSSPASLICALSMRLFIPLDFHLCFYGAPARPTLACPIWSRHSAPPPCHHFYRQTPLTFDPGRRFFSYSIDPPSTNQGVTHTNAGLQLYIG